MDTTKKLRIEKKIKERNILFTLTLVVMYICDLAENSKFAKLKTIVKMIEFALIHVFISSIRHSSHVVSKM